LANVKYTVHQAKTNLSRLLEEACAGKEVVIARGSQPVAKLVPLTSAAKNRVPGSLKGLISWTADAFDPLTDLELSDLGFE
jgi:prevent-host-death family protein